MSKNVKNNLAQQTSFEMFKRVFGSNRGNKILYNTLINMIDEAEKSENNILNIDNVWNRVHEERITIYKYSNKIDGKIYIGQTQNMSARHSCHVSYANDIVIQNKRAEKHGRSYFHSAIAKYGIDQFIFEVIEIVSDPVADEREAYWISHFNSLSPNGYNIKPGGKTSRGHKLSSEQVKKRLEYNKNNPSPMKGKHHTPEANEKNRQAHLGKKHSPETIAKIISKNTGKKRTEEQCKNISDSRIGKPLSVEHIKAISEAHIGYIMPDEQKRKISESNKGRIVSEETKHKISTSQIGKTISQETRDKLSKIFTGRPNPKKRKLSDDQIVAIRNDTRSRKEIAQEYNINKKFVSDIITGKTKTVLEIIKENNKMGENHE